MTTLGVLAGIGLAAATGWWILDPLLAIAVAGNVVVGLRLVRESVGGLMDESVPEEEMEAIRRTIHGHMDGAEEVHALRARHAGRHTLIEFHLVLPDETDVATAHAVCDRLEAALREAVPDSSTTIHVEPEDKGKGHSGVISLGSDVPHTFT